jgi:hypothetical protein
MLVLAASLDEAYLQHRIQAETMGRIDLPELRRLAEQQLHP